MQNSELSKDLINFKQYYIIVQSKYNNLFNDLKEYPLAMLNDG